MKHYVAMIVGLGLVFSANAGLIMEQNSRVTFGTVTEQGDKVAIEVPVGNTVAKMYSEKATLKWWTDKADVTNYLSAAKAALEAKKFEVAKELVNESMKREPSTKSDAQALRNKINQAAAGAPPEDETNTAGGGDKADGDKPKEADGVKIGKGKLYDALKDHLLDPKTGKKFDGKAWGKADYYLLCFVSLKFAENRDSLRRVAGRYERTKSDFGGKVEFLFYPLDADPKVLAAQIPKMKLPFPILHSKIARKTSLIKHKTSSASYAIVDSSGNLVSKGDRGLRLLIDLEDKLGE